MAGQTITDRYLAAKHSIAGQGLAKSVCKATTEEMIGPKKKHLDYLVHCTNEPNVSIPHLANLLIERSQAGNWVVVYKALITTHHIMSYGNERFTQYMASSNSSFHLSNFLDKSGLQGMVQVRAGYDMSPFIRRYAAYLNEKAMSYRSVAFDFCKIKKNKDGLLRTMHPDRLLKTIPVLQTQLDRLLDFDCSANDLTNGVINMSFMLLFRDLIRLFACYNNGIINLLEKYFDMNKKQCKDGLEIYKTFLIRMDKVGEFLKVAENIGVNNNDIPDLTKAPSSLLDALKQHLASIDSKKTSNSSTPSQSASNQKNIRSAVSALSSTSSSFGTVVASGRLDSTTSTIDETLRLQALAEEEAAMNQFKTKFSPTHSHSSSPPTHNNSSSTPTPRPTANNPFFTNGNTTSPTLPPMAPAPAGVAQLDLFDAAAAPHHLLSAAQQQAAARPSDDLLQLGNPFTDVYANSAGGAGGGGGGGAGGGAYYGGSAGGVAAWNANENGFRGPNSINNTFVSDSNFQSVFGNSDTASTFDGLGGVLQPMSTSTSSSGSSGHQGHHQGQQQQQPALDSNHHASTNGNGVSGGGTSAVLTGDLDSSLASLAENLKINSRAPLVKEIQWNSPKHGGSKVSGTGWGSQTSVTSSSTLSAGYKPMNQALNQQQMQMQQPQMLHQQQQMPVFGIGQPMQQPHSYMGMRAVNTSVLPPNAALMGAQMQANPVSMNQHQLLFH